VLAEYPFFSDEDLGTKIFPVPLRDAGVRVEALTNHFPAGTNDVDWIPVVAQREWVVLTHDRNMRYNTPERNSIMQSRLRVIVIRGGSTRAEMAKIFLNLHEQIIDFLEQNPAPFIARLYHNRIEMWLSQDDCTS
jgi:hypothetical protein